MELPTADSPPRRPVSKADHPAPPAEATQTNRAARPDRPVQPGTTSRTDLPRPPESIAQRDKQRWMDRLAQAENPPSNREELKGRLNHLEPGHPSSPWHDDGTPRPPAPRLRDLEHPTPPLSDADYATHTEHVTRTLDWAASSRLTTKDQFAIDKDGNAWDLERRKVHNEIINEIYESARDVPCESHAIIAGGLGGAGKTTVLDKHAGIDRSNFLTINPDSFKEILVERGLVPKLPGLSPMESSSLAHEESSHIARQLAARAMHDGKNIIWDVTLSSLKSASGRMDELRSAGYQHIDGVFVHIPIESSVERAAERHRRGHDLYLAGQGFGGRYVSAEIIRSQYDPDYGSINRKAFESIKNELSHWSIYDNSIKGSPAVLLEEG